MSRIRNNDFTEKLLMLLHRRMPSALQPWGEAMLVELGVIAGFWPRLRWSLGCVIALAGVCLRRGFDLHPGEDRRLDISLIAGYQFLFSATLIGLLTWQLPRITEPWNCSVLPLVICYAFAALPAVLGLGLVLGDNAARIGTIVFTIGHLVLNIAYIRSGYATHAELTAIRVVADLLIIFLLSRRPVRRHFHMSPLSLHLNDEPFARP